MAISSSLATSSSDGSSISSTSCASPVGSSTSSSESPSPPWPAHPLSAPPPPAQVSQSADPLLAPPPPTQSSPPPWPAHPLLAPLWAQTLLGVQEAVVPPPGPSSSHSSTICSYIKWNTLRYVHLIKRYNYWTTYQITLMAGEMWRLVVPELGYAGTLLLKITLHTVNTKGLKYTQ